SLYVAALEHREYEGPLNAVAPNPVTNAEFASALAKALHRRATIPIPSPVVGMILGERAGLVLTGQRVASTGADEHGFAYDYPDIASAFGELCADLSRVIEQEVWFDLSQEDVFKFFSDAKNLEMITPSFLHFRVIKAPEEGLHEGAIIEYRLRLRVVPIRWRTRIEVW